MTAALPVAATTSHPLHDDDRTWPEVNCYVDLWVELLHGLGHDPALGLGFALEGDVEVGQWTFLKYAPEDLLRLYGLRVAEANVWRPLPVQVAESLAAGRLLTVEVDAFALPDTAGISYGMQHTKTTIGVLGWDPAVPAVDYLHNRGRYRVEGADALALWDFGPMVPYVETIAVGPAPASVGATAVELARLHVSRRAPGNPVARLHAAVSADLDALTEATARDEQAFHDYAFGTVRQCGAGAQLAAAYVTALAGVGGADLPDVAAAFDRVSTTAKSLQLVLARRAYGRRGDLDTPFAAMATDWAAAMAGVVAAYG